MISRIIFHLKVSSTSHFILIYIYIGLKHLRRRISSPQLNVDELHFYMFHYIRSLLPSWKIFVDFLHQKVS